MKSVLFAFPEQRIQPGLCGNLKNLKFPRFPPLGLMYIASVIENLGHSVKIIDFSVFNYSDDFIFKQIHSADFIGMNVYTHNCKQVKNLASKIRNYSQEIKIVIGGPHCTMFKDKALKDIPDANISVVLDGENIIIEIIKYLEGEKKLSEIQGIYYREGNIIKKGRPLKIIKNLDSIPFPARHLVEPKNYGKFPWYDLSKFKYTSILTSRGCPFRCRFCSRYCNFFPNLKFRERSSKNVVEEFIELDDKYGFVTIIDDNFLVNKKRSHQIFDELIKNKSKILIQILGTRIDSIEKELLSKMKKANVCFLSFGIESGNQDVLDFYNKKISLNQIKTALKLTDDFGFFTSATFIIGAPIEKEHHIKNTINFICSIPLDLVIIHRLYFDMGSDLWFEAVKNGKISKDEFEVPSVLERGLSNFTYEELVNYQNIAFKKFYLNPKYLSRQIIKAVKHDDSLRLKIIFRILFSFQFNNFLFSKDVYKNGTN